MPISSTSVVRGYVEYEPVNGRPRSIHVDGEPLSKVVESCINGFRISIGDPFNRNNKKIVFDSSIEEICIKVFDAIKEIKDDGQEGMAAHMAAKLYEQIGRYWVGLLSQGKDILGIQFWSNILDITTRWEQKNNIKIHKGTPYFFLAENYVLLGDNDKGFLYIFNALLEDINLGEMDSTMKYPHEAPSHLTITLKDNKNNKMYHIIKELRSQLNRHIQVFNQEYSKSFTISEVDNKFLDNIDLKDIVTNFVFNFVYLVEIRKIRTSIQSANEFDRLRNLDLIFNFCLIIDETLKQAELKNTGNIIPKHYISDGIEWLANHKWNIKKSEIDTIQSQLNLNNSDPDNVIPRLLTKREMYNGMPVQGELHDLLITHKLRNYGGHNIKQQPCFTSNFDQMIQSLFNSFFLSIEVL